MSAIPSRSRGAARLLAQDVTALVPDFPFHYSRFLNQAASDSKPLGQVFQQYAWPPGTYRGGRSIRRCGGL